METKSVISTLNFPVKTVLDNPTNLSDINESCSSSSPCFNTTNSQVESIEKTVIVGGNTKSSNSSHHQAQSSVRVSVINFNTKRADNDKCDNGKDNEATNFNNRDEENVMINDDNKVNHGESDNDNQQSKMSYNDNNQNNTTDNNPLQAVITTQESIEHDKRESFKKEIRSNPSIINFYKVRKIALSF